MQNLQPRLSRARAAPLLLQQSLRRLPALPRLRQHHRFRHRSRNPRQKQIPSRRRHRSLEQAALPPISDRSQALRSRQRHPARCPRARSNRSPTRVHTRRRPQRRFHRHKRLLPISGAQKIQAAHPRLPKPLSRLRHLPRLQRHAPPPGSPRRPRSRKIHHRNLQNDRRASPRILPNHRAFSSRSRHRRKNPGRNRAAPALLGRSRPRISDAGSPDFHSLRRRSPAHPASHVARLPSGRRNVRSGRAFHRPAPPRHASPDPHPQKPARSRQYARSGRTRSRHNPGRRLSPRSRPRRRRTRRQTSLRRSARFPSPRQTLSNRSLSKWRAAHSSALQSAANPTANS